MRVKQPARRTYPGPPVAVTVSSESALVSTANALRQNEAFADVLLVVGPNKALIWAHANILAHSCEFYTSALADRWCDSVVIPDGVQVSQQRQRAIRAVISHPDADSTTMNLVLEYIYCGTVTVPNTSLLEVILLADHLLLHTLVNQCMKHFSIWELRPSNAFKFFCLCNKLGVSALKADSLVSVMEEVEEAIQEGRDALSEMSVTDLSDMISYRQMQPEQKWSIVVGWVKVQHGVDDLSVQAGIPAELDTEAACNSIKELVPSLGLFMHCQIYYKSHIEPYLSILEESCRYLLESHYNSETNGWE